MLLKSLPAEARAMLTNIPAARRIFLGVPLSVPLEFSLHPFRRWPRDFPPALVVDPSSVYAVYTQAHG